MWTFARAMLALGFVGALSACPAEDLPPTDPKPNPSATAEPVTSTRTVELPTPAPTVDPSGDPSPTATAAPDCPSWTGHPPCLHEGGVYASASARGIRNPSLARATATNRARAALLRGKAGTIQGASVVQVEACGDGTWALVQVDAAALQDAELDACAFEPPAE